MCSIASVMTCPFKHTKAVRYSPDIRTSPCFPARGPHHLSSLFSSSGSLAMPAAIFRASSFIIKFCRSASARFAFKVDIRHGEMVGVADDEARGIGFFDRQWWWEAAL